MENLHCDQTKVLSINISCCDRCPQLLKKKILKMNGVDSIDIDMKNNLILAHGRVDPMVLLNKVAKLGKNVQLLPNDQHHSTDNHTRHKQRDTRCQNNNKKYTDHRQHTKRGEEEKEEEHKCEPYEPPKVDERVCRDFYCKVHPRSRSIVDKVSGDRSSSFFGGFPFFSGVGFGSYPPDSYMYSQSPFSGYDQPPLQFGYHRPPRMLQHPFNFQ